MGQSIFGGPASLEDAFLSRRSDSGDAEGATRARGKGHLPWAAPQNMGIVGVGSSFISSIADSIPLVGQLRRDARTRHYDVKTTSAEDSTSSAWRNLAIFGSLVAGVGVAAGLLFQQGLLPLGLEEEERKDSWEGGGFGSFGEAGAALSVLTGPRDAQRSYPHGEPVVEVDVDMDGGRVKTTESVS